MATSPRTGGHAQRQCSPMESAWQRWTAAATSHITDAVSTDGVGVVESRCASKVSVQLRKRRVVSAPPNPGQRVRQRHVPLVQLTRDGRVVIRDMQSQMWGAAVTLVQSDPAWSRAP